jgi:hypothetical protein
MYYVHAGALTSSSEFFANAMKPEWRTDPTKPIDLSDEKPPMFETYCQWLYGKKIASKPSLDDTELHVVKLYVFGEKIKDETFQHNVLAAFIQVSVSSDHCPADAIVRIIYAGTSSATSPARRLLVDIWVQVSEASWCKGKSGNLITNTCVEFSNELVPALLDGRKSTLKTGGKAQWEPEPESYSYAAMRAKDAKQAQQAQEAREADTMDVSGN